MSLSRIPDYGARLYDQISKEEAIKLFRRGMIEEIFELSMIPSDVWVKASCSQHLERLEHERNCPGVVNSTYACLKQYGSDYVYLLKKSRRQAIAGVNRTEINN
ncbi:hypothetical protein RF11_10669 [Thelohanellus kitauei]|uniref:Uncharacterized protein n=1 Tax=Thelohanellus kitauei TaxID=669202 RepID=A0A0C2MBE1_THEKT|nr:hypothetical protein RF11_10669 [Thelohanellus kitauei]